MTLQQQLVASLEMEEEPMTTAMAKPEVIQPIEASPMAIIQHAISKGTIDIDTMAKLFELQQHFETVQAKKAFNLAFSNFKAESITILKKTAVKAGPLAGSRYANLSDVVEAVIPALSKHDLSHSWKLTKDEKDWMEVTCIISHSMGHSESVSMGAAPDVGPGRNAIQARASALSYLERYTLLAATGMAASDSDDDGNAGPKAKEMDLGEFDRYSSLLENAQGLAILHTTYNASIKDAGDDDAAKTKFKEIANRRHKELKNAGN